MTPWIFAIAGILGLGLLAATTVRLADSRRAEAAWARLARLGTDAEPARFDPAMVEALPAPARRWFLHAIAPGTPLHRVAEIEMEGELGLGSQDTPRYLPMWARQILAPPHGLVWIPHMGDWPMRITGSDGYVPGGAWVRFWLLGLVPVARAADTADLMRSAAARVMAEAALWVPAALLPQAGVIWEAVDDDRVRAIVQHRGESFPMELEVAQDGRLHSIRMQRWSDANPDRVFRWQSFGGTVTLEAGFDGFTVAGQVEAGNHFGTEDYFPFFRARVRDIRFH